MNGRIGGVLFEQAAEDFSGKLGLARSNEGGAPSQKQSRIVRRRLEKWLEHFRGFHKIVSHEIAKAEKLADKLVIGMSRQLPFQGKDGFGIKLSAISGEAPIAVEAWEGGFPGGSLLEEFGGFGKLRVFRAHDPEVIVRAGEDLGDERAILLCGLRFRCLQNLGRLPASGGIPWHASLYHRFCSLVFVGCAGFQESGDALGRATVSAAGGGLFVENMLRIVSEFGFAITLGIRERFLGFLEAAETTKILAKQVVGPADIALHFFGMLHQAEVLFQRLDREGKSNGFGVGFSEIEVRSSLSGIQANRVPESNF